jgi:hypothetical protein
MSESLVDRVEDPEVLPDGAAYALVYALDGQGEPVHPSDPAAVSLRVIAHAADGSVVEVTDLHK